jgi:hypothetical protein
MAEHRFNKRQETLLKVSYREFACTDNISSIDFAENLSPTGIFIASHRPMKPGTVLVIEFTHPIKKQTFKIKGIVMWSQMKGDPKKKIGKGLGIKFLGLTPDDKEMLQYLIDYYEKACKTSNI